MTSEEGTARHQQETHKLRSISFDRARFSRLAQSRRALSVDTESERSKRWNLHVLDLPRVREDLLTSQRSICISFQEDCQDVNQTNKNPTNQDDLEHALSSLRRVNGPASPIPIAHIPIAVHIATPTKTEDSKTDSSDTTEPPNTSRTPKALFRKTEHRRALEALAQMAQKRSPNTTRTIICPTLKITQQPKPLHTPTPSEPNQDMSYLVHLSSLMEGTFVTQEEQPGSTTSSLTSLDHARKKKHEEPKSSFMPLLFLFFLVSVAGWNGVSTNVILGPLEVHPTFLRVRDLTKVMIEWTDDLLLQLNSLRAVRRRILGSVEISALDSTDTRGMGDTAHFPIDKIAEDVMPPTITQAIKVLALPLSLDRGNAMSAQEQHPSASDIMDETRKELDHSKFRKATRLYIPPVFQSGDHSREADNVCFMADMNPDRCFLFGCKEICSISVVCNDWAIIDRSTVTPYTRYHDA